MSTVYMAIQQSVGREVALKVMSPVLNADPVFSERFQREANIVGQLSHPNIVSIYDIGRYKGLNYIAMDYLPGGSVHDRMRSGMATPEILRVVREIARALDVAHTKGYVHRDIKPENILFREDGTAVLTDFGVARSISHASAVTNAGTVMGTPHYMSPEQASGSPLDGRSDIYSLGIVFYEMLTGVVPYQADEAVAIAYKHLSAPIPTLPGQYAVYQRLLNRFLAKQADERFQTGNEIIDAIDSLEETLSGSGRRTPLSSPHTMNVMGLLKALLLTSLAAARYQVGQLAASLFSWRWKPSQGFYRVPRNRTTEIRTEADTRENQRATIISPLSGRAAHSRGNSGRRQFTFRAGAVLLAGSLIWSALSVGLVRFQVPTERFLPAGLHAAIERTASLADVFPGGADDSPSKTGQSADLPAVRAKPGATVHSETAKPISGAKAESAPEPLFGITVVTQPADARVRILNIVDRYQDNMQLSPGRYHVEVAKPGFAMQREWVRLEDRDLRLEYRLIALYPPGEVFFDRLSNGEKGPELVVIPAGSFVMGNNADANSSPERKVRIPSRFAASKHEITFADYSKFTSASGAAMPGNNGWGAGNRPVMNVSWDDAVAYARWLSKQTGKTYRLPTEAEWEYFARAGTTGDYWWNDDSASGKANCRRGCDSEFNGLFSSKTAPVGSFPANSFSLHDTAGNVAEWVFDCYQDHYRGAPKDGSAVRRQQCGSHPVRGGAAEDHRDSLASYKRQPVPTSTRSEMIGFRVVRELNY